MQQFVPAQLAPVQTAPIQLAQAGDPLLPTEEPAPLSAPLATMQTEGTTELPVEAGYSVIDLFLRADIIVQLVMIMLIMASIWCWAIIIDKSLRLNRLRKLSKTFEETFWSGDVSLEEMFKHLKKRPPPCPMTAVFLAAMQEWKNSAKTADGLSAALQQRIERAMQTTLSRELNQLERQLIVLASVGSAAPFIGLFGTVWGIMNSFSAIAASKQTSLAVVAPGISEALLATALGLVAAIPATIAYNKISSDIGNYAAGLEDFSSEISAIFSRQLDS